METEQIQHEEVIYNLEREIKVKIKIFFIILFNFISLYIGKALRKPKRLRK